MSLRPIVVGAVIIAVVWFGYVQFGEQVQDGSPGEEPQANEAKLRSVAFRQQILHASDLVAGMAEAVRMKDQQAVEQWQQQAVEVARAANLSASDIEFISSEKGREYLVFHAKRNLFNQQFEQRYYALQGIETLKQDYPEAQDLFAEAEQLIAARDAIIMDIAAELSSQPPPDAAAIDKAKALWQERFKQIGTAPQDTVGPLPE
ncbi:hypothetical protein [Alteromonas gilva]|uniref:Uncharacterized protein n=1 Tax=Alteromonas gilva TaxID=2987522 RepID=A0ABT5L4R3_9ALTE|nr:hypothetical protein [Alteromonas gilva]MDC8831414.1 hypothetical protein [Alteromonas gilva]